MNSIDLEGSQVGYQTSFGASATCHVQKGERQTEFDNFLFGASVHSTPMVNAVRITCATGVAITESQPMAGAQYCDKVVARVNPDVLQWAARKEATASAAHTRQGRIMEQVVGHILARCGGLGTGSSGTGESGALTPSSDGRPAMQDRRDERIAELAAVLAARGAQLSA